MARKTTFNPNASISDWNTQWNKEDLRDPEITQTREEYEDARDEKRIEVNNSTFNKYGNFSDGPGLETWANTNANSKVKDPFFKRIDSNEQEMLREYNLTSSTGARKDDWRKYADTDRRPDWTRAGEENNYPSDNRKNDGRMRISGYSSNYSSENRSNCNGNGNDESCTISGGKKTRRKKYRKVTQIKTKTKRHRKTKKYYKKTYSKRR